MQLKRCFVVLLFCCVVVLCCLVCLASPSRDKRRPGGPTVPTGCIIYHASVFIWSVAQARYMQQQRPAWGVAFPPPMRIRAVRGDGGSVDR